MAIKIPERIPEKGYYYHYKHDPGGSVNNYVYEILNVGIHTEDGSAFLVYRPLYPEASVYQAGRLNDLRPLEMFYELAEKDGKSVPRFIKITDRKVIAQLDAIKLQMYDE